MKNFLIALVAFMFVASTAFAADFSPTLLKLSAPSSIHYAFDGSELSIPVEASGCPGTMFFFVFTCGQAESIGPIQNGFLGWHYVNKIDTCLYVSSPMDMSVGSNTITWNGKNADGKVVIEGDYYYYIFAFDSKSIKVPVASQITFENQPSNIIRTLDDDGTPLSNPEIYTGGLHNKYKGEDREEKIHYKWVIGSDPDDVTLVETTSAMAWSDKGNIELQPDDHTLWFKQTQRPNAVIEVAKYKWVSNGASELQTDWGEDGYFLYTSPGFCDSYRNGLAIVENALIATNQEFMAYDVSELIYIDLDEGIELTRVDLAKWWVNLEDQEAGGQASGGPHKLIHGPNRTLSMGAHTTCMNHVIDPFRFGEMGGDIDDLTLWVNQNGDYVGDHNFEETAALQWICNDFNVGPYKYNTAVDEHGFVIFPAYDMGAVSWGLFAPDGTGVGYYSYAGETANLKWGNYFVDYDSPYDGLYTDSKSAETSLAGWFFVGHDSIKGFIYSGVGVEEEAPAAFSVAQNSPNPFNPTTTISFSLADAGNVTIDVFNVAGQKVDTIVNGFMDAGSHSVVWEGSDFSAGVYFYTVKSGDFSKTMKMTLLK